MKSFKPEVIADSSGKWCGNALRFATEAEAKAYASNLASRWFAVRETRVVPSDEAPTHKWVDDGQHCGAVEIEQEPRRDEDPRTTVPGGQQR